MGHCWLLSSGRLLLPFCAWGMFSHCGALLRYEGKNQRDLVLWLADLF